jgi:aspartate-semialdehyde dehydrogenase
MGREIRDLLSADAIDLRLIAGSEEETGRLTQEGGEPAVVGGNESANLEGMPALLLAGSPESTRKAIELADGPILIDLTFAAEEHPRSRLRAPVAEPEYFDVPREAVHVVAHPAAIVLALMLDRLHADYPIVRSVAHVFEPASERGHAGLEELQQQTISLLSFKGLPKKVFDAQLSFNLLAGYGEDAPQSLADAELRLERHLASLLSFADFGAAPMPSVRLLQAPVFHGHSFSVWVEFEDNPGVEAVERALAGEHFDVRGGDMEPPNIVGMAGQDQIGIGSIALDRNQPQACWIWAAADNLRLAARNGVLLLRKVLDAE